jgi:hypothetical protein
MRSRSFGRALALVVLSVALAPRAGATCGSTACFLVTQTSEGAASKGTLTADLSFQYVDQSRLLSGSDEVGEVLTPGIDFEAGEIEPDHHREIRTQTAIVRADLVYGLTERLSLAGTIPLWNVKDHEHFVEVGTPEEAFSGQDGTSGFGDVTVGVRYALLVRPRDLLVGGVAIKLPTGAYRLLDSQGEIDEPTIQPGSGSTDGIASLYYTRSELPGGLEAFASTSYRINRENPLDYEIGDETVVNAGASGPLGARARWSLQVNFRRAGRDRFLGEDVDSTGSTLVNVTPGLRFRTAAGSFLYALVQVPVHQDVNEDQLAPRFGIVAGVSRSF